MGQGTITDDEARKMLEMLKSLFEDELNFPLPGKKLEFEAVGENKRDLFVVSIFRGKIQSAKVNIGARIKVNGVMLLELHLNPTNVHQNPDGTKIKTIRPFNLFSRFIDFYVNPIGDLTMIKN